MEERYFHSVSKQPLSHRQIFHRRSGSILIAVPFIVCFSVFGIFNLIGGTILTLMSMEPQFSSKAFVILHKLARAANVEFGSAVDPMQVVGIMLLVTGSLLVVIGIALGLTACRSIDDRQQRRRRENIGMSLSNYPIYSLADKSTRRTSTSSFICSRNRNNGRRSLEKTVSPILEVNDEEEITECDKLVLDFPISRDSPTSLRDISQSFTEDRVLQIQQQDFGSSDMNSPKPSHQTNFTSSEISPQITRLEY